MTPTDQGLTPELAGRIRDATTALRPEWTGFLRELVRTPSQTGDEGAVQAIVAAKLAAMGLDLDVWEPAVADLAPHDGSFTAVDSFAGRPNVVGAWRGRGGRSLILNGHIDTVEIGDPGQWRAAPLGGEIVDGRLFGRGACDMKAGVVTNLFALAAVRRAGLAPRGDVIVESVISEEDGGAGALAAVLRGHVADAAVITEPTARAIVAAHGGSLMFRLRVTGRSAHACVRDEGVSAIEAFARLHAGLLTFEARRNREIEHPLYRPIANKIPINVGTVRSGSWPSSVPEWLVAEGRAGLVPGETLPDFQERFRAEIDRLAAEDSWLREQPPTVEWLTGQFAPSEVAVDSPIVGALAAAHAMVNGAPPAIEAATYGADMRHFVNTGGIPCVMYGAGDVRLAHAPDESIGLDEVERAIEAVALLIAMWCGVDDAS
ncbi:MAG TPA: ArgE/DapE family deacylase [Thermomicrobiales bacterium]|nr:ArgE/DapE family deacylase [Thermomicrobiales bacterium]